VAISNFKKQKSFIIMKYIVIDNEIVSFAWAIRWCDS